VSIEVSIKVSIEVSIKVSIEVSNPSFDRVSGAAELEAVSV
jgi:hypothetical protein